MTARALLTLAALAGGCSQNTGGGAFLTGLSQPRGEKWTIECVAIGGPDRIARAEAFAHELRRAKGIDPNQVRVDHGKRRSRVMYGTYYRRIDPQNGRLITPESLRQDLRLVQGGVPGKGGRFIGARPISSPETNVGNPEWNLDSAEGTYTLLVATFQNTPKFYERKKAAAEYAAGLRRKGHEAYYHHGRLVSEVTVGTFGPDALVRREQTRVEPDPQSPVTGFSPRATAYEDYSPEVKRLQAMENFRYQLRNMGRVSVDGKYLASQLVPIHPEEEYTW